MALRRFSELIGSSVDKMVSCQESMMELDSVIELVVQKASIAVGLMEIHLEVPTVVKSGKSLFVEKAKMQPVDLVSLKVLKSAVWMEVPRAGWMEKNLDALLTES